MDPIRRIVTGHDSSGRSRVLFDSRLEPAVELPSDVALWITDTTPASTQGDEDPARRPNRLEPPAGGSVFRFVEFPPLAALAHLSAAQVEAFMTGLFAQLGATHTRTDRGRSPGMHRTGTVDYVVLLSGEVTLLLDEGEVTLRPFDVVVQRGTSHAWENRGQGPALLAVAMIDAA
jgi:quercetin dioxygenase-like cupin family protein